MVCISHVPLTEAVESPGKRKRAAIILRQPSGDARLYSSLRGFLPQMVIGISPPTVSASAGWTIFRKLDTGIIPARHFSDQNLFIYAVHRHQAWITLHSPCHDSSENLLPMPVCGTGSFAYYSDNDQGLPCMYICTLGWWEATSSLWSCGSDCQGRG